MSKTTMKKAIKEKCLDCCCGQREEVKLCPAKGCPLWDYRLGDDPYRQKRVLTEEQKEEMVKRLQKAKLSKNRTEIQ